METRTRLETLQLWSGAWRLLGQPSLGWVIRWGRVSPGVHRWQRSQHHLLLQHAVVVASSASGSVGTADKGLHPCMSLLGVSVMFVLACLFIACSLAFALSLPTLALV